MNPRVYCTCPMCKIVRNPLMNKIWIGQQEGVKEMEGKTLDSLVSELHSSGLSQLASTLNLWLSNATPIQQSSLVAAIARWNKLAIPKMFWIICEKGSFSFNSLQALMEYAKKNDLADFRVTERS